MIARYDNRPVVLAIAIIAGSVFFLFPSMASDEPIFTGPEIGASIPAIQASDQWGKTREFKDLSGPEGLLLLFFRTVDW
ncbi:MAG: hypothetical protein V3U66_05475 [Acidobacteriota bacterium]